MMPQKTRAINEVAVHKVNIAGKSSLQQDRLAVEEPLEIRLGVEGSDPHSFKSISITMRTPGDDFELAAGFLFTEGIIQTPCQLADIRHCGNQSNIVRVTLKPEVTVDFERLQRHFYTSSSCGVCGKTSIEALQATACPKLPVSDWQTDAEVIHTLPAKLRAAQSVFDSTGGLHAAALFAIDGTLLELREDVGRHNALDKLIGTRFLNRKLSSQQPLLLVSGRASFELVQKALMAGIPMMAAVGAPSSLAVALADEFAMTLIGFVRDDRFNIYTGEQRINLSPTAAMTKTI